MGASLKAREVSFCFSDYVMRLCVNNAAISHRTFCYFLNYSIEGIRILLFKFHSLEIRQEACILTD